MARGKKHTPEQIVSLLRQIEVGSSQREDDSPLPAKKAGSPSRRTTAGAKSTAGCRWIRRGV
jgi:hypothetical protein